MNTLFDIPNFTDALIEPFNHMESVTYRLLNKIVLNTRILEDAPEEFLKIAYQIESSSSVEAQQQLALDFIEAHPEMLTVISYPTLKKYLSTITSCDPEICRQLYLLQYSIPLIKSQRKRNYRPYNWIQRLMIFCNTYDLEHLVVFKTWQNKTFKFSTKNNKADHENLHCGRGDNAADFYMWDNISNKNHAFADLKACYDSSEVAEGARRYLDPDKRYGARYVVLYMAQHRAFYICDYDQRVHNSLEMIPAPEQLFDIDTFSH